MFNLPLASTPAHLERLPHTGSDNQMAANCCWLNHLITDSFTADGPFFPLSAPTHLLIFIYVQIIVFRWQIRVECVAKNQKWRGKLKKETCVCMCVCVRVNSSTNRAVCVCVCMSIYQYAASTASINKNDKSKAAAKPNKVCYDFIVSFEFRFFFCFLLLAINYALTVIRVSEWVCVCVCKCEWLCTLPRIHLWSCV